MLFHPNNFVRICPMKLNIDMLYHMGNTFGKHRFADIIRSSLKYKFEFTDCSYLRKYKLEFSLNFFQTEIKKS